MQNKLRSHIEKIVPLTDAEFAYALSQFTVRNARKNEFLFQEDENVKYSYFVISGLLKLAYNTESGKQHIVSFAMEAFGLVE